MHKALKKILEIQELDMKLIQLMRLKTERQQELKNINSIKNDLMRQAMIKEGEIIELKKAIRLSEGDLSDLAARIKKLETQQNAVKKVDEFNALSQEISHAEKERTVKEQRLSDLFDKLSAEEEVLKNIQESLETAKENSQSLEAEIAERIIRINEEGNQLKQERDKLVEEADPETFHIYERLLGNKKDRVVVPIENRCCSGCHIMVTAQDENLVRKGERLVFCEHCSRIHYWQEVDELEVDVSQPKQRRRRAVRA